MSLPNFRTFLDDSDEGGLVAEDPLAVRRNEKTPVKSKSYAGPRCSVMSCTNKKDDKNREPGLSFHRFPKSPSLQRIWAIRTRPPPTTNLQNRFVCSIHFGPDVLKGRSTKDGKRRLKSSAVPTLHLPPPEEVHDGGFLPSEVNATSEPEVDVDDDVTQVDVDLSRDIEMVELSSDEEVDEVAAAVSSIPGLTPEDALAATLALQLPTRPTGAPKPSAVARSPRKSVGLEKSPSKSVLSLDGSMDGSFIISDEEGDDDEIALVPTEELDYIELTDPLEKAYVPATWKTMNEKSRRAALRAYFSRIASYLPPKFPRNSKMAILESATQYLDEVTKSNAVLAIEEEVLMQKHYRLRLTKRKLERKAKRGARR